MPRGSTVSLCEKVIASACEKGITSACVKVITYAHEKAITSTHEKAIASVCEKVIASVDPGGLMIDAERININFHMENSKDLTYFSCMLVLKLFTLLFTINDWGDQQFLYVKRWLPLHVKKQLPLHMKRPSSLLILGGWGINE